MLSKLGWGDLTGEEIALRVTYRTFSEQGIAKMLDLVYGSSPYAALRDLFQKLKPWQMKQAPNRFWQDNEGREHARAAMSWLVGRLGLINAEPTDIAAVINQSTFDEHRLRGMLEIVYNDSPFAALADLYPELYPWQMVGGTPSAYWSGGLGQVHGRAATRWMVAQMGLAEAQTRKVAQRVTARTFEAHGLMAMLSKVYFDSPFRALKDIYPDLQVRDMARAPRNKDVKTYRRDYGHAHAEAQAATRWVIAQLGLEATNPVEIAELIDEGIFDPVHLAIMLGHDYNSDSGKAQQTKIDAHTQLPSACPHSDPRVAASDRDSRENEYR